MITKNLQSFPSPTVTAGDFVSIRAIYQRISFDALRARGDPEKFKNLVDLVIALEKCYPNELEILRNEQA